MYTKKIDLRKKTTAVKSLNKKTTYQHAFNQSFILASSSYSRFKILKNNDLLFKKIKPSCNEELVKKQLSKKKTTPLRISLELARLKAKSVSKNKKNKLVIGCDTIISLNGAILNKAKNIKEAKKKITLLSGKHHTILSSLSAFYNMKEIWKVTQKSEVKIRMLTKKDIDIYLHKSGEQILSSVGCYQVEALGPNIIESIKGDFFNVMGLPLFPFLKFLKRLEKKLI